MMTLVKPLQLAEKHFTAVALLEDSMPLECDKKIAPFGHESPISIYEFKLRT